MDSSRNDNPDSTSFSAEEKLWLEELCTSNGFDYLDNANYSYVGSLELFSVGLTFIPQMKQFSGLVQLCLVGHQLNRIQNLEQLISLEELWLCVCSIKVIENLERNKNLRRLYLYENCIEKIENIEHLTALELLWLNGNRISKIEGISTLKNLKDLNLSENRIPEIGDSFEGNKKLETLNLTGNLISSIKDITNLTCLPKLRSLSLKDPLYSPCPVALLCNYPIHMLYHLPSIVCLDSQDVSLKSLKEMAETAVGKKVMFYKMKLKAVERSYNESVKKLEETKNKLKFVSSSMLRKLFFTIKEVEREIEELNVSSKAMSFAVSESKEKQFDTPESDKKSDHEDEASSDKDGVENYDSNSSSEDELEDLVERVKIRKEGLNMKIKELIERVSFWEKRIEAVEHSYKDMCLQARSQMDYRIKRLTIELENVGNVRFEDGTSSDSWYNAVHDLFMSRFSELDFRELPVTSVKIHRITQIYNKRLHLLFANKLEKLTNTEEPALANRDDKRVLDYLFSIWDHTSMNDGIFDKIEHGFDCTASGSVSLTNSLGVADKSRVKFILKKSHDKDVKEKQNFRYGLLLVCKTYLGKSLKIEKSEKKITKSNFRDYDSVHQTRRHAICPTKAKNKSSAGSTELCECNLRRCTWHVFDSQLVLPEYLVEFEYGARNAEPLAEVLSNIMLDDGVTSLSHSIESSMAADEKLTQTDLNIMNMNPNVRVRPRLTVLTEDLLLKHTGASYTSRITVLNFNGSGLSKLKLLTTLTNLKTLIVSFNELTTLQDLSGMSNLEYLDASFNKITSVDGFKGCIHLAYLDLSWNRLHYTREEVGLIRKYLPSIKILHLKHNNFLKSETLRLRCIGRLRNLVMMDNETVTEEETALAIRMAASSRIAYVTILAHSRTDETKPRTLSLASTTDILMSTSKCKPLKLYEDDKKWFFKVTCLQLDNQHLSKISNLDNLENLKFVSFNNNDLTKIEGLEHCPRIEELSLKGNCISKLEGLDHLLKLETLIVDDNNIMSIDATNFEGLVALKHVSLENNLIARLKSLQKAASLYDLYLGNNRISNNREIFHLKNISNLSILDLAGNPITSESPDHRLFTIYHIQSLRALDGIPVDPMEEGLAKDVYGGRLTQDFVAERLGHSNFVEVCELDLPNQGIRNIDLGAGEAFGYLTSVNLEHNNLTNFGGLIYLTNLKVLCLNYNHIESITGKPKGSQVASSPFHAKILNDNAELSSPLLDKLEVLHLGFNGIVNLSSLQLGRLRSIKTLFLQGNEISRIEAIGGLTELRELVLDKNKIKSFSENSFITQWKLTELHCEENRLRELSNMEPLVNLQRLYIGLNRLQDTCEIEKLERLPNLVELSLIGNPVSRRLMHRPMLVYRHPNLLNIDGIQVTNEERTKAELYFLEQQGGVQLLQTLAGAASLSLPGINMNPSKTTVQLPLKVTHVQLSGNNPDFAYQLGQRIQGLDTTQNLSPPPFFTDYQDQAKRQKSVPRSQPKDNRKYDGNRESNTYEGNKSMQRR